MTDTTRTGADGRTWHMVQDGALQIWAAEDDLPHGLAVCRAGDTPDDPMWLTFTRADDARAVAARG